MTIDKLTITVMGLAAVKPNGKTPDELPPETSERVRCAAMIALQHCLASVPPEPIDEPIVPDREGPPPTAPKPPLPEGPPGNAASLAKTRDEVQHVAYLRVLDKKPMTSVVRDAKRALAIFSKLEPAPFTTGRRTLANAINRARVAPAGTPDVASNAPAAPAETPYEVNAEEATPTETIVENSAPEPVPTFEQPADLTAPMELPPLPPGMGLDEAPAPAPKPFVAPPTMESTPEPTVPETAPTAKSSELLNLPPATEVRRPVPARQPLARRSVAQSTLTRTARPVANRPIAASYTPAPRTNTVPPMPADAGATSDYARFTRDTSAYRYNPLP